MCIRDRLYIGLPIVYMYSFFDTFNLRAQIGMGTAPEDDYLVHFDPHDKRLAQLLEAAKALSERPQDARAIAEGLYGLT